MGRPAQACLLSRVTRKSWEEALGLAQGSNRLDPYVSDALSPEAERVRGLQRNVDDPATDEGSAANDRDDRAASVVEVEDPDLRPDRQGAMRSCQPDVTRIVEIGSQSPRRSPGCYLAGASRSENKDCAGGSH